MPSYPVLESKVAEKGIKKNKIAESLGITPRALSKKFNGQIDFWLIEATRIKQIYFPETPIEELFKKSV